MSAFNPTMFRTLPSDASDVIPYTQSTEDAWLMGDDEYVEDEEDEEDEGHAPSNVSRQSTLSQVEQQPPRESMYVRMFADVLETVLGIEYYLFTEEELEIFKTYRSLPYSAQFLLIRLILRKAGKWHRYDQLNKAYQRDLPDLKAAIEGLCRPLNPNQSHPKLKTPDESKYIVVLDSDDEDVEKATTSREIFFAEDETKATIEDFVNCLRMPELKTLAKEMKVKTVDLKRAAITEALIQHACKQKTLDFFMSKTQSQTARLRSLVKRVTGRCLRLNQTIHQLFRRVNIVFFRSTELTATLLPLILTNTRTDNPSHRSYPSYSPARTTDIFPSRELLLRYEDALVIEKQVSDALMDNSRTEGAARALAFFKPAFSRWSRLLEDLDAGSAPDLREGPLERFQEGHVLTRIIYKGAYACGVLKRHHEEEQILRSLLSQRRWRQGRRGAWYDRLALILMNYKDKDDVGLEAALQIVTDGLGDPSTHLIYRPALEKRIVRLEKKLNVPDEDRYKLKTRLKKSTQILIKGRRVVAKPLHMASSLLGVNDNVTPTMARAGTPRGKDNEIMIARTMGKSVWQGREGEVSVEQLALEHYETLGFNGYHAEGRIILHMYTLLFWPILFDSTIPGAFETRFQSCPLDLVHDTFFPSRRAAIEDRLLEIEAGNGCQFIKEADERERPYKTWAVGVRWDDFPLEDVLYIAEGLSGEGLSTICRLLSEEYGCRASGVPDLVLWKGNEKKAMFVEVKGPGDQLRENQRVWIDVMLRHKINVEVCRVEDEDYEPPKRRGSTLKPKEQEQDDEADYVQMDEDDGNPDAPAGTRSQPLRKRGHAEVDH